MADVLAVIVPGGRARLARQGLENDDGEGADGYDEAAPGLARLAAVSVQGLLALGGLPGRRPHRLGDRGGLTADAPTGAGSDTPHARWEGFDLHAGIAVPATGRGWYIYKHNLRPVNGRQD